MIMSKITQEDDESFLFGTRVCVQRFPSTGHNTKKSNGTKVADDRRENEGEDGDVPRALDHAGHQGKQAQLVSDFRQGLPWTPMKQRPAFPAVVSASSKYVCSLFLQHLSKCLGHHKCGSMMNAFLKIG